MSRPLHMRRSKPTLKGAHDWRKGLTKFEVKVSDYLSDDERMAIALAACAELEEIPKKHFPRTKNLEYAVLKGHLIIEHAISMFIRYSSHVVLEPGEPHLRFSEKLKVAQLFGFSHGDPVFIPSIELLTKARNEVAHRFSLKRAYIDELARINAEDYDGFKISSDTERIRAIRYLSYMVCGLVSGYILGSIELTKREKAPNKSPEPMPLKRHGSS